MASPFAGRHAAPGQPEPVAYVGRHRAIVAHLADRDDPETGEPLPAGVVGFPVGGRSSGIVKFGGYTLLANVIPAAAS